MCILYDIFYDHDIEKYQDFLNYIRMYKNLLFDSFFVRVHVFVFDLVVWTDF